MINEEDIDYDYLEKSYFIYFRNCKTEDDIKRKYQQILESQRIVERLKAKINDKELGLELFVDKDLVRDLKREKEELQSILKGGKE